MNKNYTQEEYIEDKMLYNKFWDQLWIKDSVREGVKRYYLRKYGTDNVIKLFCDVQKHDCKNP